MSDFFKSDIIQDELEERFQKLLKFLKLSFHKSQSFLSIKPLRRKFEVQVEKLFV